MDKKDYIDVQKIIIPEITQLLDLRYNLLLSIKANQPIGRRNLANALQITERQVRNEIDFLHKQNLVSVERHGIYLTNQGNAILIKLKDVFYNYKDLDNLVNKLREKLNIKEVFVIPGDSAKSHMVLEFMGETLGKYMLDVIKPNSIIGLTGGSSVATVGNNLPEISMPKVTVLPARGGVGKSHSTQANSIVSMMAKKLNSQQEMLHLPDTIQKEILEALKEDSEIKHVFELYPSIDILIFGIGRADTMAKWRNYSEEQMEKLTISNAVAEVFGYFIDINGGVVAPSSTVGIKLEEYNSIPNILAIAGGKDKAQAIIATSRIRGDLVLVTDESAAEEILKI